MQEVRNNCGDFRNELQKNKEKLNIICERVNIKIEWKKIRLK